MMMPTLEYLEVQLFQMPLDSVAKTSLTVSN